MNTLAVIVTSPPYSNLSATALDYVETALSKGVKIIGIFFYQDGVIHANKLVSVPSDEYQAVSNWQRLHLQYNLPLHLCVSAAEKRGLSDADDHNNIAEHFIVSGLGELVELSNKASTVIQL